MNPPLPPRFREAAFRKYEQTIADIVRGFPNPRIFLPPGSPVTFACRLRDAIRSLRENQWTTIVPLAAFFQCVDEIVVSEKSDGSVIVGNSETVKTPGTNPTIRIKTQALVIDIRRFQDLVLFDYVLTAAVVLLHHRILTTPIEIQIVDAGNHLTVETSVAHLEETYDIAHDWRDPLTCIIV